MNKIASLFQFLFRIRNWLFILPLLVAGLVAYFTSRLPKTYEANSTIYTGLASSPSLDASVVTNWFTTNSSFDNIINLVHARSTLEAVSLKLFAQALIKGNPKEDNIYMLASNYNELRSIVPEDVMRLVDTTSIENTYQRFVNYKKEGKNNFIYGLLNWFHPYYSIDALNKIKVNRLGSSDMIEIKYSCDDPGIVHQTLRFLIQEIDNEYTKLQLGSSNDVVQYFENQLVDIRKQLNTMEDSLMDYSMASNVINYEEQTKRLTEVKRDLDANYETTYMDNYTSGHMVKQLEQQMKDRSTLMTENKNFLQQIEIISLISRKIAEIETTMTPSDKTAGMLLKYKDLLQKAQTKLQDITGNISTIKTSKEGLALQDMVDEWLSEELKYERTTAELKVLNRRMQDIDKEFARFTPIGPSLKKQEREITVTENTYQTILGHLAQAKLQQKNIEMKSTTISVVTEPIYPLAAVGSKRKLIVLVSYIACLIFIIGCFLLVELLDKTLRDKNRATYLTKAEVIGAYPGIPKFKYRGYAMETNRLATAHICNRLMPHFNPNGTTYVHVVSSDSSEGKSHVTAQMKVYWEEMGFTVAFISHNSDFNCKSKKYLLAKSLDDINPYKSEATPNIILTEFPALSLNAIPKTLLQSADVILYLVKATRAWRDRDKIFFDLICSQAAPVPVCLCLNNASRLAVEDFTGLLPPYTKQRAWSYKLLQLELTSEKNVNLEKK